MSTRVRPLPHVRSPELDFDAPVPRHWWEGNVIATHLANGVGILFPAGERFFVRSVRHYMKEIDDPELLAHIDRFFKQEGRHAKEHDRMTRVLTEQGFEVERFLKLYDRIAYGFIERISPPALRLSSTAACEHFTALLAEEALSTGMLERAHPTMRDLLLWHAAEEIEHRAVAFDVLQKVAPSYPLRLAGLAMASTMLAGFWTLGTLWLLAQERELGVKRLRRDYGIAREQESKSVFLAGIRAYLRRDFHPLDADIDGLATAYLERAFAANSGAPAAAE